MKTNLIIPYLLYLTITKTVIIAAVKANADATEIPIIAPTVSESWSVSVVTKNKMYCYMLQQPYLHFETFGQICQL